MDHERVDLSVLDPTTDQLRWERLVRRINAAAAAELRRRAQAAGPLGLLAGWARPLLTSAASIALVSGVVLVLGHGAPDVIEPVGSMADALRIPDPVSEWVSDDRPPSVADLLLAFEGDVP